MTLMLPTPRHNNAASVLPLRLHGLSFEAGGRRLLDTVDLTLPAGRRTLILGPNGAGKSLLLRLCHGLLRPSGGRVDWAVDDPSALRRAQAMVFQRPVLLRRSAAANIRYALGVHGVPRKQRAERVHDALALVGLAALADQQARTLSGGEQQRLALARAWALRPQVLLLDEPTANLDPTATRHIETVIDAIHAAGTTLMMTTHDLGQARRHADHVIFLHKGRVLDDLPAATFFAGGGTAASTRFMAGDLLD